MSSFQFRCDGSLHCFLYCPHTAHLHDVHAMSRQSTKCGSRDFDIIFFNVRGSDTTLKSVCTLGIRTLDSMRRCTRNMVLPTSLKTFTTLFFQKCFFVCETIHKNTRVAVWSKCNTSKCQWDVFVPFFSTFAFAIKFYFVTIVARTQLAIWIGTFWIVHFSSWSL